jgi:hypothetical protein
LTMGVKGAIYNINAVRGLHFPSFYPTECNSANIL